MTLLDDLDTVFQFSIDNLDRIIFRVTEERITGLEERDLAEGEWPPELTFDKPFETAAERAEEVAEILDNSLTVDFSNPNDIEVRDVNDATQGFDLFFSEFRESPIPLNTASDLNSYAFGQTSNETYLALDIVYVEDDPHQEDDNGDVMPG